MVRTRIVWPDNQKSNREEEPVLPMPPRDFISPTNSAEEAEKNPLEDIKNVRSTCLVMQKGQVVFRKTP